MADVDGRDWGPPPHAPASTTHPSASLPPTPIGGIRRPGGLGRAARTDGHPAGTAGHPAGGDRGGAQAAPVTVGAPADPVAGSRSEAEAASPQGAPRRRPLLGAGRRGRILQRPGRAPAAPSPAAAPAPVTERGPATSPPASPARDRSPDGRPDDDAAPAFFTDADPHSSLVSALEQRLDAVAAPPPGSMPRTADLVAMLLDRAPQLFGVADTAQVLADDVVERADADAAAVLVPDGAQWRVGGGVGLRPLERRLVLESTHWLVTEVAVPGRAVLIEDTDIVRQQLAGAPLAAWRHLLAVPVPEVRAAVVLARGQEAGPFTDEELAAVVPTVREASMLLRHAVEVRRLARLLGPLREVLRGEADRRQEMP